MSKNDTKKTIGEQAHHPVENRSEINQTSSQRSAQPATVLPRLGYSVEETGQILGIAPVTVYRLIQRGKLRSASGLRTKVIALKEIERFLNN